MIRALNFDGFLRNLDMQFDLANSVIVGIEHCTIRKSAVLRATGMSFEQLEDFLESNNIYSTKNHISDNALPKLNEWYLKKMRRFVRNALSHDVEQGFEEQALFSIFCATYHKAGHKEVKSWADIDEFLLIKHFEATCLESDIFSLVYFRSDNLLDRIHRSFLFRLRLKKNPKYKSCRVNTIISFILCNRYHIFTSEADSFVDNTYTKAIVASNFKFNPPRKSAIVLYPWQNQKGYETYRQKFNFAY